MPQASAAGAASPAPNYTERLLRDVHSQISIDRKILTVARRRRNAVTAAATRFAGVLRVFASGSVAHGTVIFKVEDADAGSVLDRRSYPDLGPDSMRQGGPRLIVKEMAEFIYNELKADFPGLSFEIGKRAIKFTFNDPVNGLDPYVDLIVALSRADDDALWIPNLELDEWDASHPEEHTRQLTSDAIAKELRVHRAQAARLIKACIKQDQYPVLSSFHIEARVLRDVDEVRTLAQSLARVFVIGAEKLREGDTPDPAGVSAPIKLEVPCDRAVARLLGFGNAMIEAIEHDDDEAAVRRALSRVFPDFIDPPDDGGNDAIAQDLRGGGGGGAATAAFGAAALKPVRSSGDESSE